VKTFWVSPFIEDAIVWRFDALKRMSVWLGVGLGPLWLWVLLPGLRSAFAPADTSPVALVLATLLVSCRRVLCY